MSSTDLDGIKTLAFDASGYNANDLTLDGTTMTRIVNSALKEYATERDWPWLIEETTISVTAGDNEYNVPSDWTRTNWLSIADEELYYRSARELQYHLDGTQQSKPRFYTITTVAGQELIRLAPDPVEAYTVIHEYVQIEPDLSSGTDTPLIPEEYLDLLVQYIVRRMAIRKRDSGVQAQAEAQLEYWLSRTSDNVRRVRSPQRVHTRKDWAVS